jgi:ABC-type transport system involved in multi-copper enzyme maturation permease subunit
VIWLTWRQLRVQAAAVVVGVTAMAVVLAITGPRLAELAKTGVDDVFDKLTSTDVTLFWAGLVVVAAVPALVGAFWGAPMVARELEAGTHRLVWNQSITRTRWLTTKLAVTTLVAAVAVGALTLAVTWWADPIDGVVSRARGGLPELLTPVSFAMRGVVPVAYTVFAVVLGVTLGAVLRRSLPAMAVTLALYVAVQVAVPIWVRPHLVAPTTATIAIGAQTLDGVSADDQGSPESLTVHTAHRGDWVLTNETLGADGRPASLPAWLSGCFAAAPDRFTGPIEASPIDPCLERLSSEGYTQRVVYQPAGNFWPLQLAEAALYLAASALLAGFCVWWTRARLS